MSIEIPDHKDILDRLHEHDLRLTRVEVRQQAMANEITEQTGRLEKLTEGMEKLADKVAALTAAFSGLDGKLQLVLAIIVIGIPLIVGLEIWDKL